MVGPAKARGITVFAVLIMAVVGAGVTPMSGMMGGLPFLGSSGNSTESAQG